MESNKFKIANQPAGESYSPLPLYNLPKSSLKKTLLVLSRGKFWKGSIRHGTAMNSFNSFKLESFSRHHLSQRPGVTFTSCNMDSLEMYLLLPESKEKGIP